MRPLSTSEAAHLGNTMKYSCSLVLCHRFPMSSLVKILLCVEDLHLEIQHDEKKILAYSLTCLFSPGIFLIVHHKIGLKNYGPKKGTPNHIFKYIV